MSQLLHRAVAVAVLIVLTGSPLAGSVCAAACASLGHAAAHQESGSQSAHGSCHDAASAPDASVHGTSMHACGRHDAAHAVILIALAATRADALAAPDTGILLHGSGTYAAASGAPFPPHPPSGAVLPPRPLAAPLVLRI